MRDTSITTELYSAKSLRVTPAAGGTLANSAGTVSLYFPPNAFANDISITLVEPKRSTLPAGPGGATPVVIARFDPNPSMTSLSTPAVLSLGWGYRRRASGGCRAGIRDLAPERCRVGIHRRNDGCGGEGGYRADLRARNLCALPGDG